MDGPAYWLNSLVGRQTHHSYGSIWTRWTRGTHGAAETTDGSWGAPGYGFGLVNLGVLLLNIQCFRNGSVIDTLTMRCSSLRVSYKSKDNRMFNTSLWHKHTFILSTTWWRRTSEQNSLPSSVCNTGLHNVTRLRFHVRTVIHKEEKKQPWNFNCMTSHYCMSHFTSSLQRWPSP